MVCVKDVIEDKKICLEGKLGNWVEQDDILNRFAIFDGKNLISINCIINAIARNIGVGKKVRLIFEEIDVEKV